VFCAFSCAVSHINACEKKNKKIKKAGKTQKIIEIGTTSNVEEVAI
jgi:hypothetical protein